jgi:hypothetical protein
MGLDVSVFSKVQRVRDDDGSDWEGDEVVLANAPDFAPRAVDVPNGVYRYERCEHVFSRSYGTYNRWREMLANLAGYARHPTEKDECHIHSRTAWEAESGPFWELINFTDCDGVLGAQTCKKLLLDFEAFEAAAAAHADSWFSEIYRTFHQAIRLAADGGAVKFH